MKTKMKKIKLKGLKGFTLLARVNNIVHTIPLSLVCDHYNDSIKYVFQ